MAPRLPGGVFDEFERVLALDAEYTPRAGQLPDGICYAVKDLRSDEPIRTRWVRNCDPGPPPYDPERDLVVCFSAEAELSFFRSCGWPMARTYDVWLAERLWSNGRYWQSSMLHSLERWGIKHATTAAEKDYWQQVCARGGSRVDEHSAEIIRYCASDIADLGLLLEKLSAVVDNEAVIRWGDYVAHAVRVFERGMPVDVPRLQLLTSRWDEALRGTVVLANQRISYGLYGSWDDPLYRSYEKTERLWRYLGLDKNWERTPTTGQLSFKDETLKGCEGRHPYVGIIRQVEKLLNVAHPRNVAVGPDGRCRTPERAFAALTSRSLMKAQTPLAYPGGFRAVMVPEEGTTMLVGAYGQADPGVAAALSDDGNMLADYSSPKEKPDFYMSFGSRVGAFPPGAVKTPEFAPRREVYKRVCNGILYGVGARTLSQMLGCELGEARHKIRAFRIAYPKFKRWAQGQLRTARIDGFLATGEGWTEWAVRGPAAINFPIQSTVAQITRLASMKAEASGLPVIFSLHDSLGVQVGSRDVKEARKELVRCMGDAAYEVVGLRLRVDVQTIPGGTRWFKDDKALAWWTEISKVLGVKP